MATRTAVIFIGSGHPRHGGFTDPTGVHALWLCEGAAQVWFEIDTKTKRPKRAWAPFSYRSVLLDGLMMAILTIDQAGYMPGLSDDLCKKLGGDRLDLRERLDTSDHARLVQEVRQIAENVGKRFCVCAFEDSALVHQEEVLRTFPLQIEYLRSTGVREYSPWLGRVRKTGVFATAA